MIAALALTASLVAAGPPRAAAGDTDLIPAGPINDVFAHERLVIVYDDHDAIERQARWLQATFFPEAELVLSDEAVERDLAGANVIVYGSPVTSAWLRVHADALPFAFDDTGVTLQGRHFDARRPRVIAALIQPDDRDRRALVYAVRDPADIDNINVVTHGGTEWLVADFERTLASGGYVVAGDLAPEDVRRDLDVLAETIAAVHPAAVDGLPPDVGRALAKARAAADEPLSRGAFWGLVNEVVAALHDAHSTVAPLRTGETIGLPVVWLQEGLVVARGAGRLRVGDLVRSIGGVPVADLERELARLVPAENRWWVRFQAQSLLPDTDFLRRLGVDVGDEVAVELERDGETLEVALPLGEALPVEEARRWVHFAIDEGLGLGVFTLDSCTIDDEYRRVLHAFFEAVHEAGVEHVAIDVRQNQGGNSLVVNELLRYLDVDTYRKYGGEVRWSEASRALVGEDVPLGVAEIPSTPRRNERVEDLPPYTGKVYVLTSNGTFSSGNWFAVILRDNDLAEVIGEPTGNAPSSYGDLVRSQLPRTCFGYTLSFKRWVRPAPERDPADTLEPDWLVPRTRRDLIEGTDPVLRFLRERIAGD